MAINWDQIEGNWKQFKGRIRAEWGDLTDDEIDQIQGHRDMLVGTLQERYGIAKEEAERQVKRFEGNF
jgi:uncharacterized protein YjbJ (UPF0337 family)